MSEDKPDAALLAPLRAEIDAVDADIVALLARRLGIVERVIAIKERNGIAAFLPDRVEEVVARVRATAEEKGMAPDLAERLWRSMMDWTIAYEEKRLGSAGKKPA